MASLCYAKTTRQRDNETLASPDNETTSRAAAGWLRRNYGFMESRIDGIMELRKGQVGSQLITQSSQFKRNKIITKDILKQGDKSYYWHK